MTQFPLSVINMIYLISCCRVFCGCALTGLSLMMRAGSANMSVLTEVAFAPVFSTGGGGAFCNNNDNKTLIRRPHPTKTTYSAVFLLFCAAPLKMCLLLHHLDV